MTDRLIAVAGFAVAISSLVVTVWTLPPGMFLDRLLAPFRMFNPLVSPRRQRAWIDIMAYGAFILVGFVGPLFLLFYPLDVATLWLWSIRIAALWLLLSAIALIRLLRPLDKTLREIKPTGPTKFKDQVRSTQKTTRLWHWFGR